MAVSANTLAVTASTLKEQFYSKVITLQQYKDSVTTQIVAEVANNPTFKVYENDAAIGIVYAVISDAKSADEDSVRSKK
jgi:catechol-2,3-dioxygenase